MTRFKAGDPVIVEFQDVECQGEVISHSGGYVMARVTIDVEIDFGMITPRMDPQPIVCVPESRVIAA